MFLLLSLSLFGFYAVSCTKMLVIQPLILFSDPHGYEFIGFYHLGFHYTTNLFNLILCFHGEEMQVIFTRLLIFDNSSIYMQGTTVRVEFGDATTTADPVDAQSISRSFPHTYGQPLAHFLRATAKVPDAQIITEHPPIRSTSY